jgi:hypothetical protein
MAEGLAGVYIGEVNLDGGKLDCCNCITERVGVVGISARVDHQAIGPIGRGVHLIDESALMIGLEEPEFDADLLSRLLQLFLYLVEGEPAVDARLALPEKV